MSWNTEIDAVESQPSESMESTLVYLQDHYSHLASAGGELGVWLEAALKEDEASVGLSVLNCGGVEELIAFFWQSRRWVRDGYEVLNASLEEEWDDFEELRPLFPEHDSAPMIQLAA